jgi:hypothetical protein
MSLAGHDDQFDSTAQCRVSSDEWPAIFLHRDPLIRIPVDDENWDLRLRQRIGVRNRAKLIELLLIFGYGSVPVSSRSLFELRGIFARPTGKVEDWVDRRDAADVSVMFCRPIKVHQSSSALGEKARLVGEMKSRGDRFVEL